MSKPELTPSNSNVYANTVLAGPIPEVEKAETAYWRQASESDHARAFEALLELGSSIIGSPDSVNQPDSEAFPLPPAFYNRN